MALFHSHCQLQSNPVSFENNEAQVFFDDCNEYLVVYKDSVFTVSSLKDRTIPPQSLDFVRKDAVLDVRFSLDKRHVCIMRSHTDIDVVNLADGSEFNYTCKGKEKGNMLHGFVWLNNTMCDLVLVTSGGLELLKFTPKLDSMKLVKHDNRSIHWFIYSHPNRLMLLCSGKDYNCIQSLQFTPDKLIKIPDFNPEVSSKSGNKRTPLEKANFLACKLYDKLCCVYVFAARQELIIYQLGKEAIGKLCTINLFSACDHYAVSVMDNLLVVHNTDSKITMIFDVWLQQWTSHPIAAPLPLGGPPSKTEEGESPSGDLEPAEQFIQEWSFEQPHYILDRKAGRMWGLELNLEHLCASSSDKVNLVRCLLKRRDARELTLGVLRGCVREREPLYSLLQIFTIVVDAALTASSPPPSTRAGKWWYYEPREDDPPSEGAPSSGGSVGLDLPSKPIDQADCHRHVFLPIYQAKAVEDDYLIAVTTEYLLALSSRGLMAETVMVEFLLSLIVEASPPRYNVLHQLLQYHVMQDSLSVAQRLLELEPAYPPALQLALDMLHRLKAHEQVMEALLQRGAVVQAIHYAKEKGGGVRLVPSHLLAAARESGDDHAFFAAYRFVTAELQAEHTAHRRASPSFLPQDACDDHVATTSASSAEEAEVEEAETQEAEPQEAEVEELWLKRQRLKRQSLKKEEVEEAESEEADAEEPAAAVCIQCALPVDQTPPRPLAKRRGPWRRAARARHGVVLRIAPLGAEAARASELL
eukprot:CAMPEP_0181318796 /NCGR_PEP_ID=MMETSP1101-20121128/17203_1 /TAXON_ID=46948 /ORGANISM="Rhodomonas abbreviata, Strain Caron Lab Isolate" /LENGTH=754 /DNA_ID=CAMNT_0023426301 /DNA_START=195 /DNA_END=2462 /DNA_ORIENTATION=+